MKVKITVPTKLSDITLDQYQRYLKLVEDNQDESQSSFFKAKFLELLIRDCT